MVKIDKKIGFLGVQSIKDKNIDKEKVRA